MATGVHGSTIGFSVRNFLAMRGPQHPVAITSGLQKAYDARIDEEEVRLALGELERRSMVERGEGGLFRATERRVFRHRPHWTVELPENDPRPWEGWH
jgi:hypothetical protein